MYTTYDWRAWELSELIKAQPTYDVKQFEDAYKDEQLPWQAQQNAPYIRRDKLETFANDDIGKGTRSRYFRQCNKPGSTRSSWYDERFKYHFTANCEELDKYEVGVNGKYKYNVIEQLTSCAHLEVVDELLLADVECAPKVVAPVKTYTPPAPVALTHNARVAEFEVMLNEMFNGQHK